MLEARSETPGSPIGGSIDITDDAGRVIRCIKITEGLSLMRQVDEQTGDPLGQPLLFRKQDEPFFSEWCGDRFLTGAAEVGQHLLKMRYEPSDDVLRMLE